MKTKAYRSTFNSHSARSRMAGLFIVLLAFGDLAVFAHQETKPAPAAEQDAPKIPNDQLDSLVAPIALYPDPEHRSYRSFASFSDPDGNGWLFQEVTTRLPGRIDSATTAFASANDLASALRRAEAAHGEHEKRTGGQRDANWPEWYAAYLAAEQAGEELPQ